MNTPTPDTESLCESIQTSAPWDAAFNDMTCHAQKIERQRNAAIDDLRSLADAISQFGGGASMLHPRITRAITAARKTLAIYDHPATK